MLNTYKVIILGDPSVGKTELLAYLESEKTIELKEYNTIVNLMLWNIANHSLSRRFFNGTEGMLLVFDITRSSTLKNINNWYNSAVRFGLIDIPTILIGNKAHMGNKRCVIRPLAENLCEKLNISYYYETSHLTGYNVKDVFKKIAELIFRIKVLNTTVKNQKIIVKTYQGETIETPKTPNYKILNPYWLDALDDSGSITSPFRSYPPYIEIKRVKKKEQKPLTEEEKRLRKEKAKLKLENLF